MAWDNCFVIYGSIIFLLLLIKEHFGVYIEHYFKPKIEEKQEVKEKEKGKEKEKTT